MADNPEPTRRDYGPAGCAERSASFALVAVAVVAALAGLAGCDNGPMPEKPAETVGVPVPLLPAATP